MPLPPDFEKRLWDAADQLWTNSTLLPSQYSTPVLALIFLKYADHRFAKAEKELTGGRRRGAVGKEDYHALGVLYVPEQARFSRLLKLPEGADIGKALNDAMKAIEAENDEVRRAGDRAAAHRPHAQGVPRLRRNSLRARRRAARRRLMLGLLSVLRS